jgi:hypothetical protein
MCSRMASSDLMTTVELISNFWPDLSFDKEDLQSGRPDFVARFYTAFIAELNDKLSYLINEELIPDEFDDIQVTDKEVILYCKVAKIFKKMKYNSLHLIDFYNPNPKKMYPFIKFSIHFVIYINNYLDEIFNIINDNFKKLADCQNFKVLKQQCLQDSAENAENLARTQDTHHMLKAKFERVKKAHEKMIQDQDKEEQIYSEKMAEAKRLRNEVDNLEYELLLLEGKERNLKDSIITERDFECLKNTETCLEREHEKLCNEDFDTDCIDKTIEDVKRLEECANNLDRLNFDLLRVTTMEDLRQQHKVHQDLQKKLTDEMNSLNATILAKTQEVEKWKQLLDMARTMNTELTNKLTLELENQEEQLKSKSVECAANFEEYHRLKTEIIYLQEQIDKIENDEHTLNATVAEEYQKILRTDQKTIEKFYNMLINLKNRQ